MASAEHPAATPDAVARAAAIYEARAREYEAEARECFGLMARAARVSERVRCAARLATFARSADAARAQAAEAHALARRLGAAAGTVMVEATALGRRGRAA